MWISVKDRLPKLDETVLVCRRSGYDSAAIYQFGGRYYESGEGWLWACGGGLGITPGDNLSQNDIEADDDYKITHWMRLPRAPYRRRKPIPKQEVAALAK